MKILEKSLLAMLSYSAESSTFLVWNVDIYRGADNYKSILRPKGSRAGYLRKDGYCGVTITDYGEVMAHRVVWELMVGELPQDYYIDHIDGDKCNNNPSNLRAVLRPINARNIKKLSTNTSGVTGVSIDEKWAGSFYWKAKWRTMEGKQASKSFSFSTYGSEEAFRLACGHRTEMIAELNSQGAGYTDRHGL